MKELTRNQLKQIIGGDDCGGGGKECTSNADCGAGQKCGCMPGSGLPCVCVDAGRGMSCTSDNDCGNGLHCVQKPVGSGRWCN